MSPISRITTQPTEQATFESSDEVDDSGTLLPLDVFELLPRDELLLPLLLLRWLELPLLWLLLPLLWLEEWLPE